ncbi:putative helicase [Toxoplasma gondii p89]|uniref:Putative helicase n=1 Tax=Toxoplasma gondii p89 TaxID=943119 RepID=A0A086L3J9_TOXGO|nr:putative helicase [Toxoplasma gondii p89]
MKSQSLHNAVRVTGRLWSLLCSNHGLAFSAGHRVGRRQRGEQESVEQWTSKSSCSERLETSRQFPCKLSPLEHDEEEATFSSSLDSHAFTSRTWLGGGQAKPVRVIPCPVVSDPPSASSSNRGSSPLLADSACPLGAPLKRADVSSTPLSPSSPTASPACVSPSDAPYRGGSSLLQSPANLPGFPSCEEELPAVSNTSIQRDLASLPRNTGRQRERLVFSGHRNQHAPAAQGSRHPSGETASQGEAPQSFTAAERGRCFSSEHTEDTIRERMQGILFPVSADPGERELQSVSHDGLPLYAKVYVQRLAVTPLSTQEEAAIHKVWRQLLEEKRLCSHLQKTWGLPLFFLRHPGLQQESLSYLKTEIERLGKRRAQLLHMEHGGLPKELPVKEHPPARLTFDRDAGEALSRSGGDRGRPRLRRQRSFHLGQGDTENSLSKGESANGGGATWWFHPDDEPDSGRDSGGHLGECEPNSLRDQQLLFLLQELRLVASGHVPSLERTEAKTPEAALASSSGVRTPERESVRQIDSPRSVQNGASEVSWPQPSSAGLDTMRKSYDCWTTDTGQTTTGLGPETNMLLQNPGVCGDTYKLLFDLSRGLPPDRVSESDVRASQRTEALGSAPLLSREAAGRYAPLLALARRFLADRHADQLLLFKNLRRLADLRGPAGFFPSARHMPRQVYAHVGPPNSGKTANAVEALRNASTGCYLAPLRLLAWEVYVQLKREGKRVALVTGQERVVCEGWTHLCCTVEMAPLDRRFACAVLDEAQLLANSQRGDAWTNALLGLQAEELHVCSEVRALHLLETLAQECGDRFVGRVYQRLSPISVDAGPVARLEDLETGDCLLCFTRLDVLRLKRKLELLGFHVCAVYGHLPPAIKQRQARKFNAAVAEAVAAEKGAFRCSEDVCERRNEGAGSVGFPEVLDDAREASFPQRQRHAPTWGTALGEASDGDRREPPETPALVLQDGVPTLFASASQSHVSLSRPEPCLSGSKPCHSEPKHSRKTVLISTDAVGMGLNLEIRRVVFWRLQKFSGTTKRPLTVSELRQLGGRAGRRGRVFGEEGGRVTCMEGEDFLRLKAAFESASPLSPLKKAALLPPMAQLVRFCEELRRGGLLCESAGRGETNGFSSRHVGSFYAEAIQLFCDLAAVDDAFFVPRHKLNRMLTVLHALADLPLSRQQLFTFALAPLPLSTPLAFLKETQRTPLPTKSSHEEKASTCALDSSGSEVAAGEEEDLSRVSVESERETCDEEDEWLAAEAEHGLFLARHSEQGTAIAAGFGAGLSPLVLGALRTFAVLLTTCGIAPLPPELRFRSSASEQEERESERSAGEDRGEESKDDPTREKKEPGWTLPQGTQEVSLVSGEDPTANKASVSWFPSDVWTAGSPSPISSLRESSGEPSGEDDALRSLEERLSQLEQLYQVLDLYLWLSLKYPHVFVDAAVAGESQKCIAVYIEALLSTGASSTPSALLPTHPGDVSSSFVVSPLRQRDLTGESSACGDRQAGGMQLRSETDAFLTPFASLEDGRSQVEGFTGEWGGDTTGGGFVVAACEERGVIQNAKEEALSAFLAALAGGRQLFDGACNPDKAFRTAVQNAFGHGPRRGFAEASPGCTYIPETGKPEGDLRSGRHAGAEKPFVLDLQAKEASAGKASAAIRLGKTSSQGRSERKGAEGQTVDGTNEREEAQRQDQLMVGVTRARGPGGGVVEGENGGSAVTESGRDSEEHNEGERGTKPTRMSRLLAELASLTHVSDKETEEALEDIIDRLKGSRYGGEEEVRCAEKE